MALYNNFGDYMKYERIRNLREDKDLTQQQVADMLLSIAELMQHMKTELIL